MYSTEISSSAFCICLKTWEIGRAGEHLSKRLFVWRGEEDALARDASQPINDLGYLLSLWPMKHRTARHGKVGNRWPTSGPVTMFTESEAAPCPFPLGCLSAVWSDSGCRRTAKLLLTSAIFCLVAKSLAPYRPS
ncbi:Hypothetical protein NTJ_03761 [Nesidiocoris tenuis]|uniref:Uncharacterized protein n=1 Tax=Nesidiocoris tenuis TaxID=355587 RepID=A0ABN7AKP9_9HEMI|nr:Hypothetical protein NTJ_03761 [Nesidiocoris tenuis]